jgi:hypothetical protein
MAHFLPQGLIRIQKADVEGGEKNLDADQASEGSKNRETSQRNVNMRKIVCEFDYEKGRHEAQKDPYGEDKTAKDQTSFEAKVIPEESGN